MKFLDLFSGVGGFRSGLEAFGHECVGYVEKDKFARKSYQAMYNTENEWTKEDITAVTNEEFAELKGKVDIITGGFPCFAAGTLITTSEGYKNIEDIVKGDMVLTHTNTFKEVIEPMVKHKKGIYELKIQGSPLTRVTEEHPYYVREILESSNLGKRNFSEPKWVNVEDLNVEKHLVGFARNTDSSNTYNITETEAFLLGKALDKDLYNVLSLESLIKKCGEDLKDEELSGFLLSLPTDLLKHVIEGYLEENGYLDFDNYLKEEFYLVNTFNKNLAYSLGQAIQKVYKTNYELKFDDKLSLFVLKFKKDGLIGKRGTIIDGVVWNPIQIISKEPKWEGTVYNFEVAEDNSYVANNATVHNCQSFSIAGKRLGFADETRGTLFFDIIRAAEVLEPKILFLENVKGLLNHDSGNTFKVMIGALEELGYKVDYKVFNSKYFGVPQNRERIFIVATKNYEKNWHLKDIVDGHRVVEKRILDVLEDSVDDKFYLSGERVQRILDNLNNPLDADDEATLEPAIQNPLKNQTEFGWHFEQAVYKEEGLTRTLKAGGGSGNIPKVLRQTHAVAVDSAGNPKITVLGNTSRTSYNSSNVHDTFGISPTLAARDFKGPKQIAYIDGEEYIIRKLTPLETWRLQGFPDNSFHKAAEVNSNSQLYKQSGNSVTVNVIKAIAENF